VIELTLDDSREILAAHDSDHEPMFPYGGRGHRDPQLGAPALCVEQLHVKYDRSSRLALNNVSLRLDRGCRMALIGPNGAGKSTLLKTIAGLLKPTTGTVELYGNPVGACHHRTAYLPQRSDLDWQFPMSVRDLVMTGRYVHLGWLRWPGREDDEHVETALARLNIAGLAKRQVSELSGGQQQRVLIARALVQQASLFLLDEPLNGIDEATRDLVDDVLAEHARRGGSILVATHDLGRLCESFDASIHLRDGQIDRQGP
jgi:manganese/zinc/iron transport system ATP- binding protein